MPLPTKADIEAGGRGYRPDPADSLSLHADTYVTDSWYPADLDAIFTRSWQCVCRLEQVADPGDNVTAPVAGNPVLLAGDPQGGLRAFYNVCQHRAHKLLTGSGRTNTIKCPYHARTYSWTTN